MEADKKLSVIVTVYNIENYISKCIESLVNQTYKNLEIILVNDGSTDSSGKICDKYAEKDTRIYVIHQKNQGVMKALYAGIKAANCQYVTFVDGDDWLSENAYESILQYLAEGVDVISYGSIQYSGGNLYRDNPEKIAEGLYLKKDISEQIFPKMLWNNEEKRLYDLNPALWSKIMRKDIVLKTIEKVKNVNIYYGQDVVIVYPMMALVKKMYVLQECYYYHRQRKNTEIPPYIKDPLYFSKLYQLYEELNKNLNFHLSFELQIDYFYMKSVLLKKRVYGDKTDSDKYLFPFDKIVAGSKIVLYGAGIVGQTYRKQIEQIEYCEIVAWVDKNYQNFSFNNVSAIEMIDDIQFDYLVIANIDKRSAVSIREDLIAMGIEEKKIIV